MQTELRTVDQHPPELSDLGVNTECRHLTTLRLACRSGLRRLPICGYVALPHSPFRYPARLPGDRWQPILLQATSTAVAFRLFAGASNTHCCCYGGFICGEPTDAGVVASSSKGCIRFDLVNRDAAPGESIVDFSLSVSIPSPRGFGRRPPPEQQQEELQVSDPPAR